MRLFTLPGLIDPHVHFRTPGQTHKEDFFTGTSAALAGGYTTVIDMPNNLQLITTEERLKEKIALAKEQAVGDIGFYFGSLGENFAEFRKVQNKVLGLKIYLNQTTGGFIVDENVFRKICEAWPKQHPILVHAEADVIAQIIEIAHETRQKLHIAHVSSEDELQTIITAKEKGQLVTCGVTPHHLFLTSDDEKYLGSFAKMKPTLKSKKDVAFLWKHLKSIDIIESDHAPHTKEEKLSEISPFGVPGLETTLPLLLTSMHQRKIMLEGIIQLCFTNPSKIFGIKQDKETKIEIDSTQEWELKNENLFTKCKWSPFNGWKMKGKVKRVFLRGTKVFENDTMLVKPGFGKIVS